MRRRVSCLEHVPPITFYDLLAILAGLYPESTDSLAVAYIDKQGDETPGFTREDLHLAVMETLTGGTLKLLLTDTRGVRSGWKVLLRISTQVGRLATATTGSDHKGSPQPRDKLLRLFLLVR